MDLGLSELTDDQLLDLLDQACAELAQRDGYVRQFAQEKICTRAEELKVLRATVERSARAFKYDYLRTLQATAERELREAFDAGEIRLNLREETRVFVQATKGAKPGLVRDETLDLLRRCFSALSYGHVPADRSAEPYPPYLIMPDDPPELRRCSVKDCQICQLLRDIKAETGFQPLQNSSMQRRKMA